MFNIFKVTFVIIGTIIGAGFASGQEIYTFFNRFGFYGLIGLIFSLLFISIIIYKTLKISLENNINIYQDFVEKIIPNKLKTNKILILSITNIINLFLLISFNIMAAGFSTYFFQEFNLSKIIGGLIIAIISFITFSKSLNGVIKINTYLIPTLLILIVFLGFKKINGIETIKNQQSVYWIISSILYASYNSICLIPILISLKEYLKTKRDAILVSVTTFIIMIILSLTIFLLLNSQVDKISKIEIPIVYIASTLGSFVKHVYGICILIAIFTTAVSSGYSFLKNNANSYKKYIKLALIICIISIPVSGFSFSSLISILYPVFGYLGILQIFFLLTAWKNNTGLIYNM